MNSQNLLTPTSSREKDSDITQIYFWKTAVFFKQQYRLLVFGASSGLLLALLANFSLISYRVQVITPNLWNEAINIIIFENGWANLAHEISSRSGLSTEDQSFYKTLSSVDWWKKTIRPIYPLTKSDIKELGVNKDDKNIPISLELSWLGKNSDWIEKQLLKTVDFMYSATFYIEIQKIIAKYQDEIFIEPSLIQKKLDETNRKLALAYQHLSHLEGLQKRFPGNSGTVNQIQAINEINAKYLPIINQIIATKADIFTIQAQIKELQIDFEKIKLLSKFVSQVTPLITNVRDGYEMLRQALEIEAQLRAMIPADDHSQLAVLNRIRLDLIILNKFSKNRKQPIVVVAQQNSGWVIAGAGGLLGGFFIALLICLNLQYYPAFKARLHSAMNSDLDT